MKELKMIYLVLVFVVESGPEAVSGSLTGESYLNFSRKAAPYPRTPLGVIVELGEGAK